MLNKCPTVQARGKRRPQMLLFQKNNDIDRSKDGWLTYEVLTLQHLKKLEQQAANLLARVK